MHGFKLPPISFHLAKGVKSFEVEKNAIRLTAINCQLGDLQA